MACISINLPSSITAAQSTLAGATDTFLSLSGESCNIFGALGLGELETGIQNILGAIGGAMGFINDAIAQIEGILNNVLDTALGAIGAILDTVLGSIGQIVDFAQNAITSVTGMIDEALGLLAEKAGISELVACAGVLGQLGAFPANVTDKINTITGLLSGGTPVTDIANAMIADAKGAFMESVNGALSGLTDGIANSINGSQDLITANIDALRNFSCAV